MPTSLGLVASSFDYAAALRSEAVFWIDAANSAYSGGQTVPNQGTGGTALDATLGSGTGADSNDPKWLAYAGTPYVWLPGASGNYLSVPDESALDITGDIDIRVKVAMDDWTPAANQDLLGKWVGGLSYLLRVATTGVLRFIWTADGSTVLFKDSTVGTGITDGSAKWVRATLDVDNGAGGHDVKFWTSDDGSSWSQLGSTVTTAGTTSIYSGSADVRIGDAAVHAAGKFYRAQVLNGIGGTTVLDVDTSVLASGAATSFTAATGQTVTINRGTSGRKTAVVVASKWLLGTDDYMEVADNALLDFGASDSFTAFAVFREWATPVGQGAIVAKKDSSGAGWVLRNSGTTYAMVAHLNDGTDAATPTSPAASSGALNVAAMVLNRSGETVAAYSNGVAGTPASTTAIGDMSNALAMRIGRYAGASSTYQDLELIAAAVWRRALTATEIAALSSYFTARTP